MKNRSDEIDGKNGSNENSIDATAYTSHDSHSSHISNPKILEALAFTAFLLALTLFYFFHDPAQSGGVGLPCPTHYLTGLHCPACGSQRAFHALLHLHFLEAISLNVFAVFVLFPALGYMALAHFLRLWGFFRLPDLPINRATLIPLGLVALIFTLLRNLPFAPFDWLAP